MPRILDEFEVQTILYCYRDVRFWLDRRQSGIKVNRPFKGSLKRLLN